MENPIVEYMAIRNWGRNKEQTYAIAVEASILSGWGGRYINMTTNPIFHQCPLYKTDLKKNLIAKSTVIGCYIIVN